jgi:hypothetical protein
MAIARAMSFCGEEMGPTDVRCSGSSSIWPVSGLECREEVKSSQVRFTAVSQFSKGNGYISVLPHQTQRILKLSLSWLEGRRFVTKTY